MQMWYLSNHNNFVYFLVSENVNKKKKKDESEYFDIIVLLTASLMSKFALCFTRILIKSVAPCFTAYIRAVILSA